KRKKRWGSFESFSPVRELGVQSFALQPVTLPRSIVGILNLERRELWRPLFQGRRIKLREVVEQHTGGPSIARNVVSIDTEHVIFVAKLDEHALQRWPSCEIERCCGIR